MAYIPDQSVAYGPYQTMSYGPYQSMAYRPDQSMAYEPEQNMAYGPCQSIVYEPEQVMAYGPVQSMAYEPEQVMAYGPYQSMAYEPDQDMAHTPDQNSISYFLQELTSYPQTDAMNISSGGLTEDYSILLETFNRVADQRDIARQDLSFAMETIEELKNHISGLNSLLIDAQGELESQRPVDSKQQPRVEATSRGNWIGNIWFSHPWLRCIFDAEKEWRDGNNQQTLNIMFHRLAYDDLDFEEQMMCLLLISAVFHRNDDTERSMSIADDVLRSCQSYAQKDPIQAGEIAGIAQFLRGKNLMAWGNWTHAYWAFSRAASNSKYKAKARRLKARVAKYFPEEEYIPYVPATAPLFDG